MIPIQKTYTLHMCTHSTVAWIGKDWHSSCTLVCIVWCVLAQCTYFPHSNSIISMQGACIGHRFRKITKKMFQLDVLKQAESGNSTFRTSSSFDSPLPRELNTELETDAYTQYTITLSSVASYSSSSNFYAEYFAITGVHT